MSESKLAKPVGMPGDEPCSILLKTLARHSMRINKGVHREKSFS